MSFEHSFDQKNKDHGNSYYASSKNFGPSSLNLKKLEEKLKEKIKDYQNQELLSPLDKKTVKKSDPFLPRMSIYARGIKRLRNVSPSESKSSNSSHSSKKSKSNVSSSFNSSLNEVKELELNPSKVFEHESFLSDFHHREKNAL